MSAQKSVANCYGEWYRRAGRSIGAARASTNRCDSVCVGVASVLYLYVLTYTTAHTSSGLSRLPNAVGRLRVSRDVGEARGIPNLAAPAVSAPWSKSDTESSSRRCDRMPANLSAKARRFSVSSTERCGKNYTTTSIQCEA